MYLPCPWGEGVGVDGRKRQRKAGYMASMHIAVFGCKV